MKRILVYLLCCAYTISLVKPVIPFFADTMAHIFWYSEHVATVHKTDGAYHLQIALQKAGSIPDHSHPGLPEGASRLLSEHLPSCICWIWPPFVTNKTYPHTAPSSLIARSIPQQGPPPKRLA